MLQETGVLHEAFTFTGHFDTLSKNTKLPVKGFDKEPNHVYIKDFSKSELEKWADDYKKKLIEIWTH